MADLRLRVKAVGTRQAVAQTQQFEAAVDRLERKVRDSGEGAKGLTSRLGDLGDTMDKKLENSVGRAFRGFDRVNSIIGQVAGALGLAGLVGTGLIAGFKLLSAAIEEADKSTRKISDSFDAARKAAADTAKELAETRRQVDSVAASAARLSVGAGFFNVGERTKLMRIASDEKRINDELQKILDQQAATRAKSLEITRKQGGMTVNGNQEEAKRLEHQREVLQNRAFELDLQRQVVESQARSRREAEMGAAAARDQNAALRERKTIMDEFAGMDLRPLADVLGFGNAEDPLAGGAGENGGPGANVRELAGAYSELGAEIDGLGPRIKKYQKGMAQAAQVTQASNDIIAMSAAVTGSVQDSFVAATTEAILFGRSAEFVANAIFKQVAMVATAKAVEAGFLALMAYARYALSYGTDGGALAAGNMYTAAAIIAGGIAGGAVAATNATGGFNRGAGGGAAGVSAGGGGGFGGGGGGADRAEREPITNTINVNSAFAQTQELRESQREDADRARNVTVIFQGAQPLESKREIGRYLSRLLDEEHRRPGGSRAGRPG